MIRLVDPKGLAVRKCQDQFCVEFLLTLNDADGHVELRFPARLEGVVLHRGDQFELHAARREATLGPRSGLVVEVHGELGQKGRRVRGGRGGGAREDERGDEHSQHVPHGVETLPQAGLLWQGASPWRSAGRTDRQAARGRGLGGYAPKLLALRSALRIMGRMDRKLVEQVEAVLRRRLAANVRRLRQKKELTLKVAGERAELHWRMWQKIEAAQTNATLFTVLRLANALDADPRDLLAEPPGETQQGT